MRLKWMALSAITLSLIGMDTSASPNTSPKLLPILSHWYDRITLSGQINVAGYASNHTPTTVGVIPSSIGSSPHANDLSVAFANLTADAKLYDWARALLAISYQQRSPSFVRNPAGGGDSLFVDQAYVTFANSDRSPVYAKFGRRFVDFGGLDSNSFLESTTQLLSLMRQTIAQVGFADWNKLNASVYIFRGLNTLTQQNTTRAGNYGATLGLRQKGAVGYDLGVGYISNILSGLYASSTVANGSPLNSGFYHSAVSALDLHALANWNAFDVSAKYISALTSASVLDIPYTSNGGASFSGAKPAAWGLNGGYSFEVRSHHTRLGVGYEGSAQSVALGTASGSTANAIAGVYGTFFAIGMPRTRFYASYNVNIVKWASVGVELANDKGYSTSNGGTGRSAMTGVIMLQTSMA